MRGSFGRSEDRPHGERRPARARGGRHRHDSAGRGQHHLAPDAIAMPLVGDVRPLRGAHPDCSMRRLGVAVNRGIAEDIMTPAVGCRSRGQDAVEPATKHPHRQRVALQSGLIESVAAAASGPAAWTSKTTCLGDDSGCSPHPVHHGPRLAPRQRQSGQRRPELSPLGRLPPIPRTSYGTDSAATQ